MSGCVFVDINGLKSGKKRQKAAQKRVERGRREQGMGFVKVRVVVTGCMIGQERMFCKGRKGEGKVKNRLLLRVHG
jgi:hypothetical protein